MLGLERCSGVLVGKFSISKGSLDKSWRERISAYVGAELDIKAYRS